MERRLRQRTVLLAQLSEPLRRFLGTEAAAALLLAATVIAQVWANSAWSGGYDELLGLPVSVSIGDATLAMDLHHWVDNGLMTVFFFVIGLEVRRELSLGELTDRRRIVAPMIAGMVSGLLIPAVAPRRDVVEGAATLVTAFRQSPMPSVGRTAQRGIVRAISVNERLQTVLHPWASYVVVPVFALANAGVDLRGGAFADALRSPVTWGVVLGLVLGKLLGIGGGALLAVRVGLGRLPQGVGPGQVTAGGALSGIGFTVSLLIAGLAFDDAALREEATIGVLLAAVLATVLGWILFRLAAVLLGERTAELPARWRSRCGPTATTSAVR